MDKTEAELGKTRNSHLSDAKKEKNDEFYTQIEDIDKELYHYKEHFQGKIVLLNCDDPEESNFWRYFSLNFEYLGLKKLISTHFDSEKPTYKLELIEDTNGDGKVNKLDTIKTPLKQNGDFRSPECIEILKEADIVVTNPPFSLFREYIAQLMEYEKEFLIIGNKNAITYKEVFKLIKENKLWLGHTSPKDFKQPTGATEKSLTGLTRWFTNLPTKKRSEDLILYKEYTPEEYPKYDNYDAINVDKVADIPCDYFGIMGVPITFLDKFCPEQFEIVGLTSGRDEFEVVPSKHYKNPRQVNPDGSEVNGSKANTRATISSEKKPIGTCYIADNTEGYLSIIYARILIMRRK